MMREIESLGINEEVIIVKKKNNNDSFGNSWPKGRGKVACGGAECEGGGSGGGGGGRCIEVPA